jgi:methyltransferase-like protein
MKNIKDYLKRNESIAWKDLGDHIIILDSGENKMVHHLEQVSAFIWQNLDGTHTSESLLSLIASHFDISQEIAAKDLEEFLSTLLKNNLLS